MFTARAQFVSPLPLGRQTDPPPPPARRTQNGELSVPNVFYALSLLNLPKLYMVLVQGGGQ